jgi:DNA adenine methylase
VNRAALRRLRAALRRLRAPFPYFGSKYDIAAEVWARLGNPANYVEPFAGSLACLLGRPEPGKVETVNDFNGLVVNFWRAVQADPVAVAEHADQPVLEMDLHAWHRRLVESAEDLREKLLADPEYFDVKLAGRWAWGASAWLGSGWCDGTLPKRKPHLSGGGETGVGYGRGVHSRAGRQFDGLVAWMLALADRLRFVRVCCGDFARVLTPAVTTSHGLTGVFLDPPYDLKRRASRIYASEDAAGLAHADTVAQRAAAWAIENGSNPLLRIALAGLDGEHDMPGDWFMLSWETGGGYGNQAADGRGKKNAALERIWFSPHCVREQAGTQYLLAF